MAALEFRSDTFTKPTPAMRRAMAEAEVGDDQYGEDPTVDRLERRAAEAVGKEAAVYVASGMMGNLCGVLSQTQRGDEVILGDLAHIYQNEMGAFATLGSLHGRIVPNRDGMPALADIEAAIRPTTGAFPRTALLCLENSHNNCGGTVLTPEQTRAAADLAHAHGVRVHLDGARIFNAAVAQRVDVRALTAPVDTVQFCFSKGLSAPVGSILCGDAETVAKARRVRKLLGGAMRQAGVIAAAALVALETMRDRLADDHANARALAEGLARIHGIRIDPPRVVTNIVAFEVDPAAMDAGAFQKACADRGLRISRYLGNSPRLRMVTHNDVSRADVDAALGIMAAVLAPATHAVATPAD
ncbi:MAG: aminotransferase class I/II-fold pyridoxal phosphate-dependent enzyme [Chloroflexota bacterium]|nr:aminotransferase class I/II-fold pyridoxal phosphate-dependent enzyme [Chloroflexota bacterium]MDE3103236.1 aminotransferase class I/II-fold pyridoxal phosphate-dependent enzyme [Chloroflexota bacterium]